MLIKSLIYILLFAGISAMLCLIGFVTSYYFQGEEIAMQFLYSWVFRFNGLLVGGFGYGLMWFIKEQGRSLLAQVIETIELPDNVSSTAVTYSRRANSWYWRNIIGIPITVIGGLTLLSSGYPLEGFAKYYLAVCSISIYYVGSVIFTFFVFVLLLFKSIEESTQKFSPKNTVIPLEFEHLNHFFVVTSALGVAAVYIGFRGTLTANFETNSEMLLLRSLLVLPLFLFLPLTLCYSFYPRYVLRRIYENDIVRRIKGVEMQKSALGGKKKSLKNRIELEKTLSDIKEKLLMERNQFPIVSLKDTPSLLLALIMVIQFIGQYDKVINDFFKFLFE